MKNETNPGHLLRNCVLFARLLRGLGMKIMPTQIVDLVDGLQHVDIGNRRDFKYTARTILVNRYEHLEIFDQAFDLFWQAHDKDELASLDLGMLVRKPEQPQQQIQTFSPAESDHDDVPPSDETQIDRTLTYSNVELLRQKDFSKLSEMELAQLRQLMLKTKWNLSARRTRRTERATQGDYVDLRSTFRQNLRHGGEPLRLQRRNRRYKKRPFVVICDISGSMERYSRVLLQFIYAITSELDRVEAFVFSTHLTRITRQLKRRDVDSALNEAATVIHDWAGGTRIGESIKTFNYDWARRVLGQGAVVLLISDGWDRGDVTVLGREMDRLHRSCHRLIWLNPLLGAANYEPLVRGIQAALPHIDNFMPVHNLASLEQLAELLESGLA